MTDIPFTKLFYKIGEVCELTGIRPHILRYWESEFPALSPKKSSGGQRVYQRKDLDTVLAIKKMLYEDGFTIAGARKMLSGKQYGHRGRQATPGKPAASGNHAASEACSATGKPDVCTGHGAGTAENIEAPALRVDAPDAKLADALGTLKEDIKDLLDLMR